MSSCEEIGYKHIIFAYSIITKVDEDPLLLSERSTFFTVAK